MSKQDSVKRKPWLVIRGRIPQLLKQVLALYDARKREVKVSENFCYEWCLFCIFKNLDDIAKLSGYKGWSHQHSFNNPASSSNMLAPN